MTLMNRPRAERVLDAAGLDGLLATSLENVYYLSHVWVESQVVKAYRLSPFGH